MTGLENDSPPLSYRIRKRRQLDGSDVRAGQCGGVRFRVFIAQSQQAAGVVTVIVREDDIRLGEPKELFAGV